MKMSVRTEIRGNHYGKREALWEFEYRLKPNWRKRCYELCKCECWTVKYVRRDMLLDGRTLSCENCYHKDPEYREKLSISNSKPKTHGMTHTAFYQKYASIINRCNNPKSRAYKDYWERWIKCLRNTFEEFKADMYENYVEHVKEFWERETTIDRIDVNWDYCKENCQRSTFEQQNKNKRNLIWLDYNGIHYESLLVLCEKLNLNYALVRSRLKKGWSLEEAIETPKVRNKNLYRKK